MIDELLDLVFGELVDVVPDVVWGFFFLVGGVASTIIGVGVFNESVKSGGLLITVGVLLAGTVLVEWYR